MIALFYRILALLLFGAVTACSSFATPPAQPANFFDAAAGKAKLFIYADYDPAYRPFLFSRFDARLDGGYKGSFEIDEYIILTVEPGSYTLVVNENGWDGNLRNETKQYDEDPDPASLSLTLHPGETAFIAKTINSAHHISVKQNENAIGRSDIGRRTRACACG